MTVSVLFVCLGNICRSPSAQAVFTARAFGCGLQLEVDSVGTGNWHRGEAPDPRAVRAGARRGYDLSALRGRVLSAADFEHFDYILAMDRQNLSDIKALCPADFSGEIALFLSYAEKRKTPAALPLEVPAPYYSSTAENSFDTVLDLLEYASDGLLQQLVGRDASSPAGLSHEISHEINSGLNHELSSASLPARGSTASGE
jgi:protein-tyrosine phosphatase